MALTKISKRFAAVLANDAIDLEVAPGQIHALLGENGAGKSTLVKIIYGILRPDAGTIRLDGSELDVANPHVARRHRIGMVFQHFSLFDAMSVLENVALGLERAAPSRGLAERVRETSRRYGLPLDPRSMVSGLSVGERQRIEIVRCLLQEPRLLIMDEPTSVLTPQEVEQLFATLRRLRDEGCSILYISHKLEEVRTLCDRATVLRDGKVVARCDPRRESASALAGMMVGSAPKPVTRRTSDRPLGATFTVDRLSIPAAEPAGVPLRQASFFVRHGEIFAVAGVAGNGQAALLAGLSGERTAARPEAINLEGSWIGHLGVAARRDLGVCYIAEQRIGHGAVGEFTLSENTLLGAWRRCRLAMMGLVRGGRARHLAEEVVSGQDVRTRGVDAPAYSLSGGNLQKFIVGREIVQAPRLLIAAQPTWGVDAAAAAAIHARLIELADAGCAIVLVSQDLDEIFALGDRVAVINAGELSRALPTREATREQIGLMMGGLHEPAASASLVRRAA